MSALVVKGKKIHPSNTSSHPKQRLNATIHDIDNHSANNKNSCQAKSPMDSTIINLKQSKYGQSTGSIKNVSICAKASKTGVTKTTKKTKEEVLDTTMQALITCQKALKEKPASSGLQQGGSGYKRRKSRKKSVKRNSIKHFKAKINKCRITTSWKRSTILCLPKHHDVLQLKQYIFKFTRKLRLKEFFDDKEQEDDNDDDDNDDGAGGGNNDRFFFFFFFFLHFSKRKKNQLLSHQLDLILL